MQKRLESFVATADMMLSCIETRHLKNKKRQITKNNSDILL